MFNSKMIRDKRCNCFGEDLRTVGIRNWILCAESKYRLREVIRQATAHIGCHN